MADKAIGDLNFAPGTVDDSNTLFVVQQSGAAYKLSGHEFITALGTILDGHGGVKSITYTAPVAPSLTGTMVITLADNSTTTVSVTNGKGIISVAKTGTSGLVDTYTITYNDATTQTFTVTNGAKGDTGDAWYVWIRYSGVQPTSDSDIGTIPDDWIGVYSGTESDPSNLHYTDYNWFQYKGETGDTGAAAVITTQNVSYQTSTSGTVAPSGSWTSTVPTVAPGSFLWTRTQITFNDGTSIESYSVSRYGIDGTGSVSTVNEISPDGNGNVALTGTNIPLSDNQSIQTHVTDAEDDIDELKTDLTKATGAIIYPTGDTTDRKAEIEARLSSFGYCEFAEGTFYVSDYISLSNGQTIKGRNRNSIIVCTNASEGAFVIQNNKVNVTIKDLQIKGSNTSRPTTADGQYGIWIGDGQHSSVTVDNCYFNGLGRGIASSTGYSSADITNLSIVNCAFKFCGTGIKFSQYGEYTNVSDCAFTQCYYGCAVTGGNNSFSCCVFSSCYDAFVLYDNASSGTNDGHGAATGCRFNHNDTAITITNIDYGFVFSGCNILYGDISITNSKGIIFSSCLMLGHSSSTDHTDITVTNCTGSVSVYDCDFLHQPTITVSSSPYFTRDNCHTMGGTELSPYIKLLSTSYTTNSYVTETDFNRIKFYDFNGLILCRFNLNVGTSPGTSFRTIGSVSLPFTLSDATALIVSSQNNASTLMVNITASGEISIYSAGSATGFYRDTFVLF